MKPITWLPLAAALLLSPAALAMTADELVARVLAAHGGADKLKAVQSIRHTGKLRAGEGIYAIEGDYAAVAKRPGRVRSTFTLQGFENVYALDGRDAWKIEPGGGRKDPERLSQDDAKSLVEDADFEGWLVDYKAKGHKLDYLGTEDVDGTAAHKLKLTRANGDFHYLFIDPDHFLEIRIETHRWVRGAEQVTETDLGEYQEAGGMWWAGLVVTGDKGSPSRVTTTIERIELNAAVDDAVFRFPATAGQARDGSKP